MRHSFLFVLLFLGFQALAQQKVSYAIQLGKISHDQLIVEVKPPALKAGPVEYCFPKIVPGTYANYDFGRYISNFKALDASGKELKITKKSVNQYVIKEGQKIAKISYAVDDTWDSPEIEGEYVFEPAGTSFQADTLFALNTHGLLGYFKGFEKMAIELEISHPKNLFGASSIKSIQKGNKDLFRAQNYQEIVDAPILYSVPDTLTLTLGKSEVLISVFSPNHTINAEQIAEKIVPLLEAQKNYLGGDLPVKRYAFLIVLSEQLKNGNFGALEHAQSSFYYLPEGNIQTLGQTIQDVCAHEFFHILTPLNIHSEEIGNFDFIQPRMSQHLWLYEGLTEYAAHHMQVKYGLTDLGQFMSTIQEKWQTMHMQYNNEIPFTEMSKKVLDTHKDQYSNVYQKGALLGFGLDLTLRKGSNGTYGTQDMMRDLAKEYGPNKSFKDDVLFDKLVQITGQAGLAEYFKNYITGNKELPLNAWLNEIGYALRDKHEANENPTYSLTLGFDFQALSVNSESKRVYIGAEPGINEFGKSLDLRAKDELISVNGLPLDISNFVKSTEEFIQKIRVGEVFDLEIARPNGQGGFDIYHLRAPFERTKVDAQNTIYELKNPTEAQLKLRKDWLRS